MSNLVTARRFRGLFEAGHEYSRSAIHAALGGSKVSCLPTREGIVIAACLTTVLNPRAPEVVLCGKGARTSAVSDVFATQHGPIPIFLKRGANRWACQGVFEVVDTFTDGPRFHEFIAGSGRTVASVSRVVLLARIG